MSGEYSEGMPLFRYKSSEVEILSEKSLKSDISLPGETKIIWSWLAGSCSAEYSGPRLYCGPGAAWDDLMFLKT